LSVCRFSSARKSRSSCAADGRAAWRCVITVARQDRLDPSSDSRHDGTSDGDLSIQKSVHYFAPLAGAYR
jgi:hypothetical protein